MLRLALLMIALSFATAACARDYASGQVWSYKTRPGEDSSRVLINAVESVPEYGTIFHITVFRVRMPSMKDGTRGMTDVAHLPVSKATLDTSLLKLEGKREPFAGYRAGYEEWRKAFDTGNAGVFTTSMAEVIEGLEAGIRRGRARVQE